MDLMQSASPLRSREFSWWLKKSGKITNGGEMMLVYRWGRVCKKKMQVASENRKLPLGQPHRHEAAGLELQ